MLTLLLAFAIAFTCAGWVACRLATTPDAISCDPHLLAAFTAARLCENAPVTDDALAA